MRAGQVKTGHVRKGQVRKGQVKTGHVRTGKVRTGQVRTGQVWEGVMVGWGVPIWRPSVTGCQLPPLFLADPIKNPHPQINFTGQIFRENFPTPFQKKLRDVLQEREGTSLNYFNNFLTISNNFLGLSRSILLYLYFGPSWSILVHLGVSTFNSNYFGLS